MNGPMDTIMSRLRRWAIRRLVRAERAAVERQIGRGWDYNTSLALDRLLVANEVLER